MSTTLSRSFAETVVTGQPIFEITAPSGTSFIPLAGAEKELLLKSGTVLRIDKIVGRVIHATII
jgi:hypothetical protein